jgi:dolichol-phosphate mannosyltransferase
MINKSVILDIVIPFYNESLIVDKFYKKIQYVFFSKRLKINKIKKINLIFVDDGSTDESILLIKKHSKLISKSISVKIVKLSRNFGHSSAVWAGLKESKGDIVVVMDFDLQDPPEVIYSFLKKWRQGYLIVNGKRRKRNDNFFKKLSFWLFYRLYSLLSDVKIEQDTGDFSLIDKQVLKKIILLQEKNKIFRFARSWIGYKCISVEYERFARVGGKAKYSIKEHFNLAFNTIFNSSLKMFKLSKYFIIFFSFSIISLIFYTLNRYQYYKSKNLIEIDFSDELRLWFLVVILVISFNSLFQTLILAVLSSYFKRTHIEVQNRPQYISEKIINVK